MNTRFSPRATLFGLAAGVLLALLLAPQSRWLVRYQLAAVGLPFGKASSADTASQQAAAAYPADLGVQMAARPDAAKTNAQYVTYLRTLTPRFGNRPSLYAALLRGEVGSSSGDSPPGVFLSRPEESELSGSGPGSDAKPVPLPAPALLAAFDADAARGEALDPDNAYFPMMRAIGLFAAHRDAAALDAVQRAASEPVWNEYLADEVNGRLRLTEAAYGHAPSISRLAIAASELYPQYAPLRAAARVATVLAVHAEQAGDRARGMSIRRAVMQDGDLMRVQGTSYICNLVGIAISAIARSRPGGAEVVTRPGTLTAEQWAQARLNAFVVYAQAAGFPADAARAQAQFAAGEAARAVWKRAEGKSLFSPNQTWRLAAWWGGSLLTLANAFWLLVLGGVGGLLSRVPGVRERLPLPAPVRGGIWSALALGVLLVAYMASEQGTRLGLAFLAALVVAGAALLSLLAERRSGTEGRRRAAQFGRSFGAALAALAGVALAGAWQAHGVLGFVAVQAATVSLSGGNGPASNPSAVVMGLLVVGFGLLAPLLLAIGLSIGGRRRRVPVSGALAAGFGRRGVPVACLLLVVYGAAALGTLGQERRLDTSLSQMIRHEGRYYASLAGVNWPGPA